MSFYMNIGISLAAGIALGGIYFGGLLYTVRQLPKLSRPGLFFAFSMIVRLALAVATFYFLARSGQWERVVIALLGFLLVRIVYLRQQKGTHADGYQHKS